METKSRIVRTPNGHGGSLKALVDSGVTEKLCEFGHRYSQLFSSR